MQVWWELYYHPASRVCRFLSASFWLCIQISIAQLGAKEAACTDVPNSSRVNSATSRTIDVHKNEKPNETFLGYPADFLYPSGTTTTTNRRGFLCISFKAQLIYESLAGPGLAVAPTDRW